ncbi:TIGR02300 family protein [Maritalea mobilis]|uniref:TIGR02300 family protein n=1 Tax=[Roseibacterium] beibuensis TaxID=1193142 RepID=A0ABP9LD32_9RHOB|nr:MULTISPECIES: TIGR02300 family protein [Alphaproteobacteria]MBY6202173.1 TIGR02300 family protein [Maritalea mobilis]MCS6624218.1 TIGR02300 family protein [Roseibacterium beibuensis]
MPKEEWGVKRVCPTTGKRFYDLNQNPIVSPYTGEVVELDTGKGGRTLVADKADPKTAKKKSEEDTDDEVVLDDDLDIDDDSDVDIDDDDVLDDDDDSDTVALDDLADVASDDSDES